MMQQPRSPRAIRWPVVLLVAAFSVAAYAQLVQPTPYTDTPVSEWTSAHGSLFDAGLSCGTANTTAADTLALNECQARMVAYGVDNERSNIITLYETASIGGFTGWDRRPIAVYAEYVGLDGGAEVPISGTSSCVFWRSLAGGDAGLPWFIKTSQVLSVSSVAGARGTGFFSATPFQPGYYCFVPVATNPNLDRVFMRLSRMYQPREIPR